MSLIEKLTPEQEALIPVYREKWRQIALSTKPIDRQKAAEAVKAAYKLIGESEPEIIYFDSPYAAARHGWWGDGYSELDYWDLLPQLRERLPAELFNVPLNLKEDQQLFAQVRHFENLLVAEADEKIQQERGILCEEFSEGRMQTDILCWECGWFDFCISELKFEQNIEWEIYQNILKNCGRIYDYQEACFVCDRPRILCFDNQQRLHAEGAPAIQYADGFSVYAYHGTWLSEEYGKIHPNQWQAQWLLSESNAELRRALIQEIGYAKICQELQAVELNTWQEYTLLKIDSNVDVEPIYLLKMTCPSTGHLHALRVPPNVQSAREAITWVNWGIDPEEFSVQT